MSKSNLSPFEFKDLLIAKAMEYTNKTSRPIENAARGNPDFLATSPRHAMITLGEFAMLEAERSYTFMSDMFGGEPLKKNIVNRWDSFAMLNNTKRGVRFLSSVLSFCESNLGIDKDDLLYEFVLSYLGCSYPVPPRMLVSLEKIVVAYLQKEMNAYSDFDLFATEGGTAAMTYIFQSLKINGMLSSEDKVAMITPIFTPYLEIPKLPMYNNEIINIKLSSTENWQLTQAEVDKLKDPDVKILCVVNPSNPPSVALSSESMEMLVEVVKHHNPNLMIITDDVYATFIDDFESLFSILPYNTLLVYSFSKYFGATGWRIGAIGINKENVFDKLLSELSDNKKEEMNRHYHGLTNDIPGIKFIDRMVADSRAVALNHTAGVSLPQQLQMSLFSIAGLMDYGDVYKKEAITLIKRRYKMLYSSLNIKTRFNDVPYNVGYYTLISLSDIAGNMYGNEFKEYLLRNYTIEEFLLTLAKNTGVVLMPGDGFSVSEPLVARVSLANLKESNYALIGKLINEELKRLFKQSK